MKRSGLRRTSTRMTKNEALVPVSRLYTEFRLQNGRLLNRRDRSSSAQAGDEAGSITVNGYRSVYIDQMQFMYHRIVYAMANGFWPDGWVDHIDRNKSNNHPDNLRDVTPATNIRNTRKARSNNSTGKLGVSKARNKFRAKIMVDGKLTLLGNFDTEEQAEKAYLDAKTRLHPEAFSAGE